MTHMSSNKTKEGIDESALSSFWQYFKQFATFNLLYYRTMIYRTTHYIRMHCYQQVKTSAQSGHHSLQYTSLVDWPARHQQAMNYSIHMTDPKFCEDLLWICTM